MNAESFSAQELLGLSQRISARVTAPLVHSRLMLHEIAPRRVHACWQIAPEELAREPAGGVLILRLHDTAYMDLSGANPHASFDLVVNTLQGHHYAELPGREDTTALAELGWRLPDRRLALIAKSELVRLPAASPAPYSRLPRLAAPGEILQPWFPLPSWREIAAPEMAAQPLPAADSDAEDFCSPAFPIATIRATPADQIFSSFCCLDWQKS
jgi:hypothetical protein